MLDRAFFTVTYSTYTALSRFYSEQLTSLGDIRTGLI